MKLRSLAVLLPLLTACSGAAPQASVAPASIDEQPVERQTLDASKVSYAMRGNEERYRRCFMRSVTSQGAISTRFDIDEAGRVERAIVEQSTLGNPDIHDCILGQLSEQKFGERSAPSTGRWTFVFRLANAVAEEEREELLQKAEEESAGLQLNPQSPGRIDLDRVDQKIQASYQLYAHCYRDSIARRGESRGLVQFRLRVDTRGHVVSLEDAGSVMPDPLAVDCMAEAFYAIDFPPALGDVAIIDYSLVLE